MSAHMGLVLHIAQGSYEGTIAWGKNPNSDFSSHFVVAKSGAIAQLVDTDYGSWCQSGGNQTWLSVENEGNVPDALTPAQLAANARILAKVSQVYGVPLQISNSPSVKGLGHHAMGGLAWGNHLSCPGQAIIDQKAAIVSAARAILSTGNLSSSVLPTPGGKMHFIKLSTSPIVFLSNGIHAVWVQNPGSLADYRTLAGEGTLQINNAATIRVVANRLLIGRIVGAIPAGFEDLRASL